MSDRAETVTLGTLSCDAGPVGLAVGPRGVLAVLLPGSSKGDLAALAARRLPGARQVWADAQSTPAGRQLAAYLAGRAVELDAPVDLRGMPEFTRAVMQALRGVGRGSTVSYGQLAAMAGSPRAARAVGQVMAKNPLPLFVPCHRVLASGGAMGGFSSGLDMKRALLDLEAGRREAL